MVSIRSKSSVLRFPALILLVLIVFALTVSAQTDRLAEAKTAFDEAMKLYNQGTVAAYRNALTKFETSVRLYREGGDKNGAGQALVGMGLMNSLLGENASAIKCYTQALTFFQETSDKIWESRTLNNLGLLHNEMGEAQKALEYHQKALRLRKENKDRAGEATSLNSLGVVYLDLGENQKALETLNSALAIRRETGNKSGEAITLNNIGRVYDELGQERKALDYFTKSATLRSELGDKIGRAITLNNIGLVYSDLGEYQKSLENYEQSLAIINEFGTSGQKATVLNNMGTAYMDLKQPPKSLEYHLKALPLNRESGRKSSEATTLNNIGFAYKELNDIPKSLENLHQALLISRTIGSKGLEAIVLSNLMLTAKVSGKPQTAVFYGKQSVNKYQELRRAIKGMDAETQRAYLKTVEKIYRFLADLLIEQGRFAQAEQVLRMLKEQEYFDFVRRDADEIKTLSQRVALNEKEQLLLKRYSKLADRVTEIGDKFELLNNRKRRLSRSDEQLSDEEQKQYEQLSAQLADANAAFRLFLEKELTAELGTEKVKKIELDRNLQDKLRKWGTGTVAVYTVVTENRYRVILTTPTIQIDGKTEIKADELNKKIFAFREVLQNPELDPRPLGKEIYDILLKPIEKELKAAGAKTLIWSLDGTLRYIPLAALSPDAKTYLVEKFQNVILTPKTRDDISEYQNEWKALGFGVSEEQTIAYPEDPNETVTLSALPGTKTELNAIIRDENNPQEKGILAGKRFLDKKFTLENLTDSLVKETPDGRRKYTVVHLASHFRLGANWSESFLVLGNSKILTLEELSNSPEITFGDVELITLSACNTAFSDTSSGREVDSLAEAIQTKSGKAVLASLWEVSDESTSLLMSNFYRFRKENPSQTKAEAMQKAQKMLLASGVTPTETISKRSAANSANPTNAPKFVTEKNRPFAHPYYWSGFVLIGNWR
jgi:CHAT domain-containing protein/Tfp pilus assembly protein PilF